MLFTFPSRYYFTIGRQTYLALGRGRPGFRRNFTCSALLGWRYGGYSLSLTGLSPSVAGFPYTVQLKNSFVTPWHVRRHAQALPLPHARNACGLTRAWFRLYPFRSPLLRASLSISLPPVTEMFHFTGSPPTRVGCRASPAGFPHSDTHGSMAAYPSPWLFAVRCVLRRRLAPRHPPRALSTLTSYFSI